MNNQKPKLVLNNLHQQQNIYLYHSQSDSQPHNQQQQKIGPMVEFQEVIHQDKLYDHQKINQKLKHRIIKLEEQNHRLRQHNMSDKPEKGLANTLESILKQNQSLISHYKDRCEILLSKLKAKNDQITTLSCQKVKLKGKVDNLTQQLQLRKAQVSRYQQIKSIKSINKQYESQKGYSYDRKVYEYERQSNQKHSLMEMKNKLDQLRQKKMFIQKQGNRSFKRQYYKANVFNTKTYSPSNYMFSKYKPKDMNATMSYINFH